MSLATCRNVPTREREEKKRGGGERREREEALLRRLFRSFDKLSTIECAPGATNEVRLDKPHCPRARSGRPRSKAACQSPFDIHAQCKASGLHSRSRPHSSSPPALSFLRFRPGSSPHEKHSSTSVCVAPESIEDRGADERWAQGMARNAGNKA